MLVIFYNSTKPTKPWSQTSWGWLGSDSVTHNLLVLTHFSDTYVLPSRCFLSVETKPVALIIKNILQCALDFRHCFTGGDFDYAANGTDPLNLRYLINFSQVIYIYFLLNVTIFFLKLILSNKLWFGWHAKVRKFASHNHWKELALSK